MRRLTLSCDLGEVNQRRGELVEDEEDIAPQPGPNNTPLTLAAHIADDKWEKHVFRSKRNVSAIASPSESHVSG